MIELAVRQVEEVVASICKKLFQYIGFILFVKKRMNMKMFILFLPKLYNFIRAYTNVGHHKNASLRRSYL